jgi:hypothetical protein
MYEQILDEIERRNLAAATLGELSTLANTTARYGLGTADTTTTRVESVAVQHLAALRALNAKAKATAKLVPDSP